MISVIVPVLDEAKALPQTLAALLAQRGDCEVIVVDGGSRDATREIARAHAGVRLESAPKGRASQMNAGAAVARGEVLLFLHADTRLPEGAIERLGALAACGDCEAGGFRHRFSPCDWRLRLVSALTNLRCRLTRIYYGDQAMFVRADLFRRLGGFPEVRMLEDILFCERLRRVARTRLLDEAVETDARRFLQQGVFLAFGRALLILARHKLGLPQRGRGFTEEVR